VDFISRNLFLSRFSIIGDLDEAYLSSVPAVKYLREHYFESPVTFFCGENGTGKSTLLEALAIASGFNAEGGTRNMNFATRESHSTLHKNINITRSIPFAKDGYFLRAESFYNVATELDRLDRISIFGETTSTGFIEANYGGKSMHGQSHGESFMSLVKYRFRKNGLFFLDEPESALSPTSQMSLLCKIHELVNSGSQFVIATHSPILMSYPASEIIEITSRSASVVHYKETENYTVTRCFLDNPEKMLYSLLNSDS